MHRAIIVIGHGSRAAEANAQFETVVELVKTNNADDLVLAAYMEMTAPSLSDALVFAATHGASTILVVPCLLFQGIHAHTDIPRLIASFTDTHPSITVRLGKAIGADPLLAVILQDRIDEIA